MKKGVLIGFVLLLSMSLASISIISCDDEVKDTLSCTELAAKVSTAAMEFNADQTVTTCNAYKKAIQNYIDGCDKLTDSEEASLQLTLDGLDCSIYD